MILYKTDTKEKLRCLEVYKDGDDIVQLSGLVGGALTERRSRCVGKNIGKANETDPEEQAKIEVESKIKRKLREGYFETKYEALNTKVIKPMLAKEYTKEKHKVVFPCWVQPKLDGMRCLAFMKDGKVTLMSRKNVEITTMPHIKASLLEVYQEGLILDGELYCHGLGFQHNMSLIKKYRGEESHRISYHVYDIVDESKGLVERIIQRLNMELEKTQYIEDVPHSMCRQESGIKEVHLFNLTQKYEGSIIRWGKAGYKLNGRSDNLLKYKDFIDKVYKIVDIKPSERDPDQGMVVCQNDSGNIFGCGMKFSHSDRREMLFNKDNYIGQMAEIRFFEYTDDGLPRFPVCVGIRLDK